MQSAYTHVTKLHVTSGTLNAVHVQSTLSLSEHKTSAALASEGELHKCIHWSSQACNLYTFLMLLAAIQEVGGWGTRNKFASFSRARARAFLPVLNSYYTACTGSTCSTYAKLQDCMWTIIRAHLEMSPGQKFVLLHVVNMYGMGSIVWPYT